MQRRRALRLLGISVPVLAVAAVAYGFVLSWQATREFDLRGWDVPARVFAAPLELYAGRQLTAAGLITELERLGYTLNTRLDIPGSYARSGAELRIRTRAWTDARARHASRVFTIAFDESEILRVREDSGTAVVIAELDPLPIGSLFPSHGEDRIVLSPQEVPPLLIEGLKAVEDRRFDDHFGIDLRGIVRAAWVNLRSGALEQGASTLTQQLIRSYYLDQKKSFIRKIREAFMAIALEAQTDKDQIALAYVNEVYLGQDGARAIHGFGLAAQHFFAKPLTELELHELALLIGQVRGPSWYDPRRHPERARQRRDQVLAQMLQFQLITQPELEHARGQSLGVTSRRASGYFAAFLDLVRRQLRTDYAAADLETRGLQVFTTLDPSVQAAAEGAIIGEIEALQSGRASLNTALVVTTPHDGEVKAIVGGRRPGFNRALDARRPIGSVIKPAVYLAALETGEITLATRISDDPIEVTLADGRTWSPLNFDDEFRGELTVARGLTDSVNTATVRLGMQIGVDHVAEMLRRLGIDRRFPAYPSVLLGAIELTPFEVASMYNTIANGGFRQPLRSVRTVLAPDGGVLQRSHIGLEQVADPADVYALNSALVEVMRSGTGKTVARRVPAALATAGKTGTSDDFRDSWFAGYSGQHLAVVWIGNDANEPVGLTGATGAGRIWANLFGTLSTRSFDQPQPAGVRLAWIDLDTGLVTEPSCPQAAQLAVRSDAVPPTASACGSHRPRLRSRLRRLFDGSLR